MLGRAHESSKELPQGAAGGSVPPAALGEGLASSSACSCACKAVPLLQPLAQPVPMRDGLQRTRAPPLPLCPCVPVVYPPDAPPWCPTCSSTTACTARKPLSLSLCPCAPVVYPLVRPPPSWCSTCSSTTACTARARRRAGSRSTTWTSIWRSPPLTLPALLAQHEGEPFLTHGCYGYNVDLCEGDIAWGPPSGKYAVELMLLRAKKPHCWSTKFTDPELCLYVDGHRKYIFNPRMVCRRLLYLQLVLVDFSFPYCWSTKFTDPELYLMWMGTASIYSTPGWYAAAAASWYW